MGWLLRKIMLRKKKAIVLLCISLAMIAVIWFSFDLGEEDVTPLAVMPTKPIEPKYIVLEPPKVDIQRVNTLPKSAEVKEERVENNKAPVVGDISKDVTNTSVIKVAENKTHQIEKAKNETLAQMGVLGDKESKNVVPKILFEKLKWNLTISFDDIGNVMKDTEFLSKLKPLDLSGPVLTSTRNRTSNFTFSMPIKMGYCDCWEHYCFCCVQLVNKQLHLNAKTCSNFTFVSKSHNLELSFSMDNKTIYQGKISADAPPMVCLGSIPSVADMCVHFSNMTYKVDSLAVHKSRLLGCTDFSLNIYNKTISVFPVDCFQIPGDPAHGKEENRIMLPNFVP